MKIQLSTVLIFALMMMFTQPPYLAGCAVGHAGALVAGQVEVGGTGTLVASSRREEAEVTAAAVVRLARVVEHWGGDRNVLTSGCTDVFLAKD